MSTTTENLGLIKPDAADYIDIGDINDNMDVIDADAQAKADAIETLQGNVTTLQGNVNGISKFTLSPITPTTQSEGDYWYQNTTATGDALAKELLRRKGADTTDEDGNVTAEGTYSPVYPVTHTKAVLRQDGTTPLEQSLSTLETTVSGLESLLKTIYIIPTQSGSLTFTGSAQTPSWNNYDADKLTLAGTTSGTDVGTYTATFTPTDGYQWDDGTTTAKSVTWSIGRASITTSPSQSGSLTYTGASQTPAWSNYSTTQLTIAGVTSGTNAGTYSATFTPTANYQWDDGTVAAKSVTWTIGKAAGSVSLSVSSLSLSISALTGTITVTRLGDGTITASSSATGIATVSVSGTTVIVTAKATGTATITVSVAAGTNYTAPSSVTCSVTVTVPSTTLNSNTPAMISTVSAAGLAASYWDVGDTIGITLSGTVGKTTFSNLAIDLFILGINHNSSREGTKRIHFKMGKKGGVMVGLVDSAYGDTVSTTGYFAMNSSNTNRGGWSSCQMHSNIMPAMILALPAAWRAVLKTVTKYTDNTGGGSDTASYVTATTETMCLEAQFEIFGARSYVNSAEQNYQAQYDYYIAGNAKVHYCHSATTTAARLWLRSPIPDSSKDFCYVYDNGAAAINNASKSYAVSPLLFV